MLVATQQDVIATNNLGEGNTYSIANNPKAFEILSSTLYQDKIGAVIRELLCNAIDANIAAGKPWNAFKVTLPSFTKPYFIVEDSGPGLSHNDVMQLYTTYFRSTKDHDNSAIGGFGLGSKSPFAVADQFTVESRFNGELNRYICYKNNGIPNINHVERQPLLDPTHTGLTVIVPVTSKSYFDWQTKYEQFLMWQPETPDGIFAAYNQTFVSKALANHNQQPEWFFSSKLFGPHIFMGRVLYKVDVSIISDIPKEVADAFASAPIVINLPIGSVEIAPSRESLSYTPATCNLLVRIIKAIIKEFTQNIRQRVDQAPTLYEAMTLLASYTYKSDSDFLHKFIDKLFLTFTWKGQPLAKTITFVSSQVFLFSEENKRPKPFEKISPDDSSHIEIYYPGQIIFCYKSSWRKTFSRNSVDRYNFIPKQIYSAKISHNNLLFFFHTKKITSSTYSTITHYLNNKITNATVSVVIFAGTTFDELNKVIKEYGLPEVKQIELLPPPPKTSNSNKANNYKNKNYAHIYIDNKFTPATASIDLTVPGYYVSMFNGHIENIEAFTLTHNIKHGYLVLDRPLVAFTRAKLQQKKFAKILVENGWQQLTNDTLPYIIGKETYRKVALVQTFIHSGIMQQQVGNSHIATNLVFIGAKDIIETYPNTIVGKYLLKVLSEIPYPCIKNNFIPDIAKPLYEAPQASTRAFIEAAEQEGVAAAEALISEWKQILAQFPLLKLFSGHYTRQILPILGSYLA